MARKATSQDREVSMNDAAENLGMTAQAVGVWATKPGAPVLMKGGRRYALWPAFPIWYRQQLQKDREKKPDFEDARARKTQAEAELAEIELEAKRGEVVTVQAYRDELRGVVTNIRAQLLAVPGRYAPRTAGLATLPESQRAWDAAVRDIMRELRDGDSAR